MKETFDDIVNRMANRERRFISEIMKAPLQVQMHAHAAGCVRSGEESIKMLDGIKRRNASDNRDNINREASVRPTGRDRQT